MRRRARATCRGRRAKSQRDDPVDGLHVWAGMDAAQELEALLQTDQ